MTRVSSLEGGGRVRRVRPREQDGSGRRHRRAARDVVVRMDAPRAGEVIRARPARVDSGDGQGREAWIASSCATRPSSRATHSPRRADGAGAVAKLEGERGTHVRARWERIAREAARQSGRADVPRVDGPLAWTDALGRDRPGRRALPLVGERDELARPAARAAARRVRAIAFAVGPEGGITEDEAREAASRGWAIASLGPYILRTETVAAAVLGARCASGATRSSRRRADRAAESKRENAGAVRAPAWRFGPSVYTARASMKPLVGIIIPGSSSSDWETMETRGPTTLESLGVPFEVKVVSAHPHARFALRVRVAGRVARHRGDHRGRRRRGRTCRG